MRYPAFLKPNGRIGLAAPSFGCTTEPYRSLLESACRQFSAAGYHCVSGPNCFADSGIGKSNTPEACGAELNDFFLNDRSDILLSCGGGETMCEDLSHVDFPGIAAAKPKWFMGYSDNTNLTFTLPTLCDTAAIYGPNVSDFGQNPRHEAVNDAWKLLCGETLTVHSYPLWERSSDESADLYAPYQAAEPCSLRLAGSSSEEVQFSGRLLGGCMDILNILCGTQFDRVREFNARYADDGVIWFLEACELRPMGIRRALWQLEQAGWFENARGFLIGRPMFYDAEEFGQTQADAVLSALGHHAVPIVLDADIGHLPPMMPLVCGAMADVRVKSGSLTLKHRFE